MENKNYMILDNLNPNQKAAVLHNGGPLRIIAGAGSGKTGVLTRKIAYLIESKIAKPYQILAVTFTNKATDEMKERVISLVGEIGEKVFISTFHSLCNYILRIEIHNLEGYNSKFDILDTGDQKYILESVYRKMNITNKDVSYGSSLDYISKQKNKEILPEEAIKKVKKDEEVRFAKIFSLYEEELSKSKSLDFDDLQIFVKRIFDNFPDIKEKWANRFSHILVDEFQDTSYVQYEIIRHLFNTQNKLTIVGDPDQTIYTWRGADANLILNFDKDFANSETITLDQNYRSTKNILDAANRLIKNNRKRLEKNLFSDKEEGEEIEFYHAFSVEAEARWVVSKINELKKQKVQLKNIAIFYRSNFYSRAFEEALIHENINHNIYGGQKFFERSEIKDIIAYLKVINDGSPLAFNRIINVPSRKIGPVSLQKIEDFAESIDKTSFEALIDYFSHLKENKKKEDFKELPLTITIQKEIVNFLNHVNWARRALETNQISIVISKFLEAIKYFDHYKNDSNEKHAAEENVKELISSIRNWEVNNQDKELSDYLEEISLLTENKNNDGNPAITLMTIHASKGLEFQNVFLVGMSEGIFPAKKVMENSNGDEMEEERRLAYVAITRAKERLFISDSKNFLYGTYSQNDTSRFVSELGIKSEKLLNFTKKDSNGNLNYQKEQNVRLIEGDLINHLSFGIGTIVQIERDTITVTFKNDNKTRTIFKNHKSWEKVTSEE